MQSLFRGVNAKFNKQTQFFSRTKDFYKYKTFSRFTWKWASSTSHNENLAEAVDECANKLHKILDGEECNLCIVFTRNYDSTKKLFEFMENAGFPRDIIIGRTANILELPYDKTIMKDQEATVLSITAASLPGCKIFPFHVESECLPDLPINWIDYQNPQPVGQSASLLLLMNRFCFDEEKFMKMLETALPVVPKLGVAFGSRTLTPEKDIYADSLIPSLIHRKKEAEKREERMKKLKECFQKPNFSSSFSKNKRQKGAVKKSVLIDSSLPTYDYDQPSLPISTTLEVNKEELIEQKQISDNVGEEKKDEEEDEEDIDDEDEIEIGQEETVEMKREMMFVKGKRYFRGAAGLLIQGPYRQTIFSSSMLFPIDKPKLITGTSEELGIDDLPPLKFLSKLAAKHKTPTQLLTKYSFFYSITKKNNGDVITKAMPKPVGSAPDWWSSDTSFLNVGDKVQFYIYNGEKGMDNLMEKMKNAPVDYTNAGSVILSSNIEPEYVDTFYHDYYRDHDSFRKIEDDVFGDEEDIDENDENDEGDDDDDDDIIEDDDIIDDDDDDDNRPISTQPVVIDIRDKMAELSVSDIEHYVKETLISQSNDTKDDESDDEFEHTFYESDFKHYEKIEKKGDPPLHKTDNCDEITRINLTFDSLPSIGVYGLCNFSPEPKSPLSPSFLSSTVIVFEPPK